MSDSSNTPVARNTLARQGVQGVVFAVGGIVLMVAAQGGPFGIFNNNLGWLLWIMRAAGLVLAGVGVYWIVKFIVNLRKRM